MATLLDGALVSRFVQQWRESIISNVSEAGLLREDLKKTTAAAIKGLNGLSSVFFYTILPSCFPHVRKQQLSDIHPEH